MYWFDSDAVHFLDALSRAYIYDKGELRFNNNYQAVVDNRCFNCFKWYPFSISQFIGPLVEKRKALKLLKDNQSIALNKSLNDCVNTFYGVFTSVFF